ncbi:MAG TPA: primosomal protein N' [Dissulfurispiraceae bacterium]|nr:primosomal protein N' [Dissulfurispiraceae bacterium]
MFADVIFPLKLAALTYKLPDDTCAPAADLKGRIVKAPLARQVCFGIIADIRENPGFEGQEIREITSIHEPYASPSFLNFLMWMAEYYLVPVGLALKSSFFDEAVAEYTAIKRRTGRKKEPHLCPDPPGVQSTPPGPITEVVAAKIRKADYSALLYHAPDIEREYSTLLEIIRKTAGQSRGYLIVVPEKWHIDRLAEFMHNIVGERLCILHSQLTKKERAESIKNILSGKADVLLGTRSAALAPLQQISFIAVLEEHSPSYKGEEGLHYNARDLAVMRGFIEKKCVLLSSVCPSLETVFNVRRGKYSRLNRVSLKTEEERPRIRIAAFKSNKQSELSLSPEIVSHARNLLMMHQQVLFLVGRKGYSLIRCADCGHIASCRKCSIPLPFYKSTGMLRCHHCGGERRNPEHCDECGGNSLQSFSAGTEKVREDVSQLLKSPSLLLEKAEVLSNSDDVSANPDLSDFVPIVVGTSLVKRKKCREEKYSSAVLMNVDLIMAQPDFRAYEKTFQEIIEVSQMVKPDGSLFIQTRAPGSKVLRCLKHYDFEEFYDLELSQRKDLDHPPYARMILFTVFGKQGGTMSAELWRAVREIRDTAVTILGPVEVPSKSKSYERCCQVLLKSRDSRKLHKMAKTLLGRLESDKKIRVVADVDPFKIL